MRWNWRLLIPVGMLLLAGLGCALGNQPFYEVIGVEIDLERPGTAYAVLDDMWYPASRADLFYETADYGIHWQESEHQFSSEELTGEYRVTLRNCDVRIDGQTVWTFPRQEFISVLEISSLGLGFPSCSEREISLDFAISPADSDMIYIAMGRNGVLIGPVLTASETRAWHLSHTGLPISPVSLSSPHLSNTVLLLIPAFSLILLPSALLHLCGIQVAWQHFLGETIGRRRYIWAGVLLGTTLALATVSAIIWMVNEDVSYRGMLAVASLIATAVSLIVTIRLARENGSDGSSTLKAMLSATAVTPVVAILLLVSWWIPLPLLLALLPVIYLGAKA